VVEATGELWRAWRSGREPGAFEALVRPHLSFLLDVARRAGCRADEAQDALQESLVLLARERSDEPVRVGLRAWLGRRARLVARKSARSFLRRFRRERGAARSEAQQDAGAETERRDEVESLLRALSEKQRQAVVLRFLHDLDYREISYLLGIPEGACRLRVHRGIERMRKGLGDHAAALVGALPLPAAGGAARILAAAVRGSGAAGAAGAVAKGGWIMAGAWKLGTAAVAGAAVATTAILAADARREPQPPRSVARAAPPAEERSGPPEGLALSREEEAWIRDVVAKERLRREQAVIRPGDSALDVLRRYLNHGADISGLLRDYDRFRAHFRFSEGPVARIAATDEVTTVNLDEAAGDAAVIEFGPGEFRLDPRSRAFHWRKHPLASLEIRGAGMDRTILRCGGVDFLHLGAETGNLLLRDLALDGERILLDLRGEAAALLERVRILGWSTAGHGAPVGVSWSAFLGFRGCEFTGGRGWGLSLRGNALATFDSCAFLDMGAALIGSDANAAMSRVHLRGCTFDGAALLDRPFGPPRANEARVTVSGGIVRFGSPSLRPEERAAKWGARFASSVEGVSYEPQRPPCTPEDLAGILRSAPYEEGRRIRGVWYVGRSPAGGRRFVACYVHARGNGTRIPGRAEPDGSLVVEESGAFRWIEDPAALRGIRTPVPPAASEADRPPFVEALSRARIEPGTPFHGVWETRHEDGRASLDFHGPDLRPFARFDAWTGEPLALP